MVARTLHNMRVQANETGQKHRWAPSGSFLLNESMVKPPLYSGGTGGICCFDNLKYLQPKCNFPVCFPPFSFKKKTPR